MKKLLICTIFLLISTSAFAEKVKTIDTTGWTQRQKIRAEPALVYALHNAGRSERAVITKTGDNEYTLTFPDTLPNGIFNAITAQRILDEIAAIDAENAVSGAAEQVIFNNMKASIRSKLTTGSAWTNEEVTFFYKFLNSALND